MIRQLKSDATGKFMKGEHFGVQNNTKNENSKEIKDFAIEMHNYLLNKEIISTENLLQVKFWDIYKKYFIKSNYFNNFYKTKFKNNTRISNSFLKRNSEWFLND